MPAAADLDGAGLVWGHGIEGEVLEAGPVEFPAAGAWKFGVGDTAASGPKDEGMATDIRAEFPEAARAKEDEALSFGERVDEGVAVVGDFDEAGFEVGEFHRGLVGGWKWTSLASMAVWLPGWTLEPGMKDGVTSSATPSGEMLARPPSMVTERACESVRRAAR